MSNTIKIRETYVNVNAISTVKKGDPLVYTGHHEGVVISDPNPDLVAGMLNCESEYEEIPFCVPLPINPYDKEDKETVFYLFLIGCILRRKNNNASLIVLDYNILDIEVRHMYSLNLLPENFMHCLPNSSFDSLKLYISKGWQEQQIIFEKIFIRCYPHKRSPYHLLKS